MATRKKTRRRARRRLPAKVERCVRAVKRRRRGRPVNPYAVCRSSVNPRGKPKTRRRRRRAAVTRTVVRSSSVRTVRRSNPRPRHRAAILIASRAGSVLRWDGRHFSAKGRAKFFGTLIGAYQQGEQLLRRHPILRRYKLYVRHV